MTVKRLSEEDIARWRDQDALEFSDFVRGARDVIPRFLDEVQRTRALLRRIEWSARVGQDSDPACPECEEWEPGPHAADCELAALIGAPTLPKICNLALEVNRREMREMRG